MHSITIPDWAVAHVIANCGPGLTWWTALTAFYVTFGDVMTSDEVISCIGGGVTLKAGLKAASG